jgi:hypothetical protein
MVLRVRRSIVVGILALTACGGGSSTPATTTRPPDQPAPPVVAVTLTSTGCSPQSFSLRQGPTLFQVTNPGASVTEMEIQDAAGHLVNDVEGVGKGRTRSFLVNLRLGVEYRVRCPETQKPWGSITVTP